MQTTLLLYHALTCASLAVCFSGAALLSRQSMRGAQRRARRALAFILMMWGLAYLCECSTRTSCPLVFDPMSVKTLIVGNLYIIVALLYPLEVAQPGWITPRRVTLLALPYATITAIYPIVLALGGESVRPLDDLDDLVGHLGEFNVWYRFVLYLSVCFYLAFLWLNTSVAAIRMHRCTHDDPTPLDRRQVRLLRTYGAGIACITVAYWGVLLSGTLASRIIYRLVVVACFTLAICMAAKGEDDTAQKPEMT